MVTGPSSIPIRLKALGFASYRDYLKSDHWQEFRARVLRESAAAKKLRRRHGKIVCSFCFSDTKFNLHHKTYKRLGKERMDDVAIICDDCHEASHARHEANPRKGLWNATKRTQKTIRRSLHPLSI